jgi:hypothetical protein
MRGPSQGSPPSAASSTAVLADTYVNQAIYATTYDAVQAALDAAWTAAQSAPVDLEFGPKLYNIDKGSGFAGGLPDAGPRSLKIGTQTPYRIRITGKGRATIQFGPGTPAFIGPKTPVAGATYGGQDGEPYEIDGFRFDANNAVGGAVGIITDFNTNDINIGDWWIHDTKGLNAGIAVTTSGRRWVNMVSVASTQFDVANPRTGGTLSVERNTWRGGNTGVTFDGSNAVQPNDNAYFGKTVPAANFTAKKLIVRDLDWDAGTQQYFSAGSAGIQGGGSGMLLEAEISGCKLKGGVDVGIELGTTLRASIRNTVAENFTNEGFFISANHGGMPVWWTPLQHIVYDNCTAIRSDSKLMAMNGFEATSNHGARFGVIEYNNCKFVHSAPAFLTSTGALQGSPSAAFAFQGSWNRITVRNPTVVYQGWTYVHNSSTNLAPKVFSVAQSGDWSVLEIKGGTTTFKGTMDNTGGFSSRTFQADVISTAGSRLIHDIDGHRVTTDIGTIGTPAPAIRVRDWSWNFGPVFTDTFTGSSLAKDWVLDAGALTDLNTGVSPVTSAANHTTRKLFKAPTLVQAASSPQTNIGRVLDASIYTQALAPAAGPAGMEVIARLRVSDDGLTGLRAVYDGTAGTMRIEKVEAGTVTGVVAGPTAVAAIAGGGVVVVRLRQQNDLLTADLFTTGSPSFATVGATRLQYTLTATDNNIFRGNGNPGFVGFGWTPGAADGQLVQVKYEPMTVFSGVVRGLSPIQHNQTVAAKNAIVANVDSTRMRVENAPLRLAWQRFATGGADLSTLDATQKQQILVEPGSSWGTPPTPTTIAAPGSGVAVINQDGYIWDAFVYGYTLTTPFVEVTRDGGVTWSQVAGVSGEKAIRCAPNEGFRLTYSTAGTIRKVPVL